MADPSESDAQSILRALTSARPRAPIRFLVTGEAGSGKTIFCSQLVGLARGQGMSVRGVISLGVYAGGRRVAIELWDIGSDERRPLARLRPEPDPTAATKRWEMDPEGFDWGNSRLNREGAVDLLIVDEIGPLEFVHNDGLQAAFEAVDRGDYRAALIVVRPSLLDEALKRWPDGRVLRVSETGASGGETA